MCSFSLEKIENMTSTVDSMFWSDEKNPNSSVVELEPKMFNDSRGWFSEVLRCTDPWIKQINRSSSKPGVVRGCHAQRGKWCQAKLVEAVNELVFDFIIDARPDSKTFGTSKLYRLDPAKQNKLFVPRGFLHSMIVPTSAKSDAIFTYYCDNIYCKEAEISVCPLEIVPRSLSILRAWCNDSKDMDAIFHEAISCFECERIYSEKDKNGLDYDTWMKDLKLAHNAGDFERSLWYK